MTHLHGAPTTEETSTVKLGYYCWQWNTFEREKWMENKWKLKKMKALVSWKWTIRNSSFLSTKAKNRIFTGKSSFSQQKPFDVFFWVFCRKSQTKKNRKKKERKKKKRKRKEKKSQIEKQLWKKEQQMKNMKTWNKEKENRNNEKTCFFLKKEKTRSKTMWKWNNVTCEIFEDLPIY